MKRMVGLTVAAIIVTSGAFAEEARPANEIAEKDRLVCKTKYDLGSRIAATKECATAEEWARMRREQRADLERNQVIGMKQ